MRQEKSVVVPDGYFENFAENLMEQLPENHSQEPPGNQYVATH